MKNLGEDFTDAERAMWPSMNFEAKRALMLQKLDDGAALFSELWNAPVDRIAVENPVMHKHAKARIENYQEFSQSVQPWQYGDWERKRTCLWLKGLAPLQPLYPTLDAARLALGYGVDDMPDNRVHRAAPGPDRSKERSKFFPGVARQMALQWGGEVSRELAA